MARSQRDPEDYGEIQATARRGDAGGFKSILRGVLGLPSAAAGAQKGEYPRAIARSAATTVPRPNQRARGLNPPAVSARRRGGGGRYRTGRRDGAHDFIRSVTRSRTRERRISLDLAAQTRLGCIIDAFATTRRCRTTPLKIFISLSIALVLAAQNIVNTVHQNNFKETVANAIEHVVDIQISKAASSLTLQLPPFASLNTSCDTNPANYNYCRDVRCQEHRTEIEEGGSDIANENQTTDPWGCKTLWFAGMHEVPGQCTKDGSGYQNMYGAALNSAIINAREALQPVLMLGRLGLKNKNAITKFGSWARKKGALVFLVPRLEYQEAVDGIYMKKTSLSKRQGPWLRLEIPRIVKEHGLFDLPNVCQRHVLYTDSDVIFANKIRNKNIRYLTEGLSSSGAIVSYGRESGKQPGPINTGVMVIDVARFGEQIPGLFQLLKTKGHFSEYDQGLINEYFRQNSSKRHLLPIHYNWKLYWKLEPSTFDQVKIIHLHGPKPNKGLEAMSSCNATILDEQNPHLGQAYSSLLKQGICCDKGRTASWGLKTLHMLFPPPADICD